MDKTKLSIRSIQTQDSILKALKQMDTNSVKLLIVFDEEKFVGILTIGDIQRCIINNHSLEDGVSSILDKNKTYCSTSDSYDEIKSKMLSIRAECMPVLNSDGSIFDVVLWEDLFPDNSIAKRDNHLNLPVVIMAGGKGTRLAPLTNVLPKPLIPISNKTIIEEIMDRFVTVGCNDFRISVNYKAEMIEHYLKNENNTNYNLTFFKENKPLGTAGSLSLLKDKIKTSFFVSNCDIIINDDYSEIFRYHKANHNEITLVAALKYLKIPYGTISTREDGLLDKIEEKPEYVFKINAGLYILEPELLNEIPNDTYFHITNLVDKLLKENRRVGVFPVSEKSWMDIGNWDEYMKLTIK